jgi:hypothetical protein
MPEPIRANAPPQSGPVSDDPPPSETKSPQTLPPTAQDALSAAARQLADKYTASGSIGPTLELPKQPDEWLWVKLKSEAACLLPCSLALRAGKFEMPKDGVAQKTMDHFLSGSGKPMRVDLNAELARNPQLQIYVASRVEAEIAERAAEGVPPTEISGAIWVPQSAYGESEAGKDQRLSLGGTYFEYQVAGSAASGGFEVRLNVADNYFWSPKEPRPTQCLHECGSSLVAANKAVEFSQLGEGALIVNQPWCSDPAALLAAQAKAQARDDGQH